MMLKSPAEASPEENSLIKPDYKRSTSSSSGGRPRRRLQRSAATLAVVVSGLAALVAPATAGASATVIAAGATAISVGSGHSCALLSGGSAECWGSDADGELGDGVETSERRLAPVAVSGLTGATAIASGSMHTCALLAGGTAKCWGFNALGELGDGTHEAHSTPVAVSGLGAIAAIGTGVGHTCALLTDGTARCWGSDAGGRLGDGKTSPDSNVPVTVSGLAGATAIGAGEYHTCAVVAGGAVECWGENWSGQLGDGTTANSSLPVAVSGVSAATAVSAGYGHSCALLSNGTAECWGTGTWGQLGDGAEAERSAPVAVAGLSGATAISAGGDHSCALLSNGTAECWGHNSWGELGAATRADHATTPLPVVGLHDAVAISAGDYETCALLAGGAVECWGSVYGPRDIPASGGPATATAPTPPQVRITSHPPRETAARNAGFTFTGVAGGSYQCSIDEGAWNPCKSGDSFGGLLPGDHRFRVRETLNGLTGPADSYSWTVDLPRACVLRVARARVFAYATKQRARLVIHYKAYRPAQVTVSYRLHGTKGDLALGSVPAHFQTAGVFRLPTTLSRVETAQLRAAKSIAVRFQIPQAPGSCSRYYAKRLTIPRAISGQTVWFQSDSVFGGGA